MLQILKSKIMELLREVTAIINRNIGKAIEIKPQDRLMEDLHVDSLDTMLIWCEIEDKFHVTIDPGEVNCLAVVQDIVDSLAMKLGCQTVKT
jgi:acyl carrier protein